MTQDQIIYLILGIIILFLAYQFHKVVNELNELKSGIGRSKINPPTIPPPPRITRVKRKNWHFIIIDLCDMSVLNSEVKRLTESGYALDEDLTNEKYLAFVSVEYEEVNP